MLDPRVEQGLDLPRHGLAYAAKTIPTTALSATGDHLVLEGCYGASVRGSLSEADRAAWAALRSKLLRFAGVLRPLKDMTPARLGGSKDNELMKLAKIGLKARLMGRDDLRELMRMLLINVADVLNDDLVDDRLKGVRGIRYRARRAPRAPLA